MKRFSLPKLLAGLILAAAAIFAVYRLEFRPVPVAAHTLATGEVRGEVMGTGTLEYALQGGGQPESLSRPAGASVGGPK